MTIDSEIYKILPHREPMIMIDQFTKDSEITGTAVKQFSGDDYGCENGMVLPGILIECVAQTIAAHHGLTHLDEENKNPAIGMLVTIDHFEFCHSVPQDAKVTIKVEKTDEIGAFHIIKGEVFHNSELAAHGQVKIFIEDQDKGETH